MIYHIIRPKLQMGVFYNFGGVEVVIYDLFEARPRPVLWNKTQGGSSIGKKLLPKFLSNVSY